MNRRPSDNPAISGTKAPVRTAARERLHETAEPWQRGNKATTEGGLRLSDRALA